MSEVSKVPNTVLLIKDQRACVNNWSKAMHVGGVESGVWGFYTTLHTEYCYSCQRCWRLLNSVYSGLSPLPGGKAISAFHLWGLAVHHWSEEAALLTFLGLSTIRVIAGKTHSQSPILTLTKGALSNPVILTYLWEQSCILHTLTKTACLCNLKNVFNAWRMWACRVPLALAGSVFDKVGSHEQVD